MQAKPEEISNGFSHSYTGGSNTAAALPSVMPTRQQPSARGAKFISAVSALKYPAYASQRTMPPSFPPSAEKPCLSVFISAMRLT